MASENKRYSTTGSSRRTSDSDRQTHLRKRDRKKNTLNKWEQETLEKRRSLFRYRSLARIQVSSPRHAHTYITQRILPKTQQLMKGFCWGSRVKTSSVSFNLRTRFDYYSCSCLLLLTSSPEPSFTWTQRSFVRREDAEETRTRGERTCTNRERNTERIQRGIERGIEREKTTSKELSKDWANFNGR